jgi:hypothetical protein
MRQIERLGLLTAGLAVLALPASAQVMYDGNIYWNCGPINTTPGGAGCPGGAYTTASLVTSIYANNSEQDPQLDPSYNDVSLPVASPVFRPLSTSPALSGNGATVMQASAIDPWFENTCFVGALDADAGADWTEGWTYYGYDGGASRTDIDLGLPVSTVTSNISTDTTWDSARIWALVGRIAVEPGVTLTIDPGVVIVSGGFGSYLVVERGGTINAVGTEFEPIVFTSGSPLGSQAPGDWSGLVIHGQAVANCAAGGQVAGCNLTTTGNDCESEGGAGFFGGSNDDDSSGELRYVRVEYAGQEISPNNELNAFTFNALGRGTQLSFLQAHLGTDDLFEWFGGAVRSRYFVGTAGADDGLDWQMGYRGLHQYAVIQQKADIVGRERGIEADNNEFDFNCPGESYGQMANLTLIGSVNGDVGARLRRGTNFTIINSITVDFPNGPIRVSDDATFDNCPSGALPIYTCATGVEEGIGTQLGFRVQVAPTPIVANSTFSFSMPRTANVELNIYNAQGRLIDTVHSGELDAGPQTLSWMPRNQSAGVYFYSVKAGDSVAKGKLMVLN